MRRGYLTVVSGKEVGRRFVLRLGQRFTIGRGHSVTIPVEDHAVSRRHVEVELVPDGLFVTDLGSMNGTFVDDQALAVDRPARLEAGGRLRLGGHVFVAAFSDAEDEEDIEATRRFFLPTVPEEFEVLGELGRGATGIVYAARQRLLNRRVAIKVPRADHGADKVVVARRFLREARLQAQVDSPYVVSVHDIRQVHDRTYLVLELVNGYSARDRLLSDPITLHEALRIGEFTALALDAVHRAKVVHRDVKPSNILLTLEGAVKLSDFGIAKGLGEATELEPITGSGEGLGTLCYVAPEQMEDARQADARSDIFSLGATLYHLISGFPHIPAGTEAGQVLSACMKRPRLADVCACPHDVASLVEHMLELRPADRPGNAGDLATKLRDRWQPLWASSKLRSLGKDALRQTTELQPYSTPEATDRP